MSIAVLPLDLRDYEEVWDIQKKLQADLIAGTGTETLVLCEHTPVITMGRSAKEHNVLASADTMESLGVKLFKIERGGDVTFHGPGQLVAYPILNLTTRKRDVDWYMRSLEEVILRTLSDFGITAMRVPGKTGVWVKTAGAPCEPEMKKIASIGVRISRWCTLHGLSINVHDCSAGFSLINPCGFTAAEMTCMDHQVPRPTTDNLQCAALTMSDVYEAFLIRFSEVFGVVARCD